MALFSNLHACHLLPESLAKCDLSVFLHYETVTMHNTQTLGVPSKAVSRHARGSVKSVVPCCAANAMLQKGGMRLANIINKQADIEYNRI